ncbi:response regulator PleD [compost metagenome]
MPAPGSALSVSIGVATLTPRAGQACLVLVDMADQGLYQAKNNGRNQVAMVVPDPAP